MQFFGRISMSLYLSHEPLIFYLETAVNGKYERDHSKTVDSKAFFSETFFRKFVMDFLETSLTV